MIDLHCHILPGIDDGAQTVEEAVAMAESAAAQGIEHLLCTPHHNNGKYDNPAENVILQVHQLQNLLDMRQIPITLYEGQEVRISGDLPEQIKAGKILFVDLNNKYLLIEFPANEIPVYAERLFLDLIAMGHRPIIVHPERNQRFIEDPNRLIPFIELGTLTQMTAPSYIGIFGREVENTAKQMVENNLVHMMASDAHNVRRRNFFMKRAFEEIANDFGKRKVTAMEFCARDVLNGDEVDILSFKEIRRKKFRLF
ncbi:tyrosine protein phosphatase [Enterococcus sp. BWB1-3]|uniref:tyrosine-protein phosphatase n=1 Tax=Enterococcus sp. BWB1-3 TaxID=2787713 RepID=UPI001923E0B7|nr:CpsB/CapC family capsule biosynthesis tyrosine phosphatase [Enterococcus sp. BWB1-3]MBL1228911.1 tyrosine protein phosphatase [Enterococcus sp. BWB1-3]